MWIQTEGCSRCNCEDCKGKRRQAGVRGWEEIRGEERARWWSEGRKRIDRITEALQGRKEEEEQEKNNGEKPGKGKEQRDMPGDFRCNCEQCKENRKQAGKELEEMRGGMPKPQKQSASSGKPEELKPEELFTSGAVGQTAQGQWEVRLLMEKEGEFWTLGGGKVEIKNRLGKDGQRSI